jgi:putative transposase
MEFGMTTRHSPVRPEPKLHRAICLIVIGTEGGVETVLLRSDTGEEIAADPLKIQLPEAPNASKPQTPPIDELCYSDADWAAATRRRDCIAALAANPTRTTSDVNSAVAALGLSPRRIWSLLRQIESAGDGVAQFLPARGKASRKRLSTAAEAIIEQAIDQHYAKRSRPGLQSLVNEVAGRCAAAGLSPASSKAVKARVRARNQVWLVGRREGRAKTRSLRLLTGAHPGAAAPWELVQIDSTPCDIRPVREQERTIIGRPNVTFAIDLYSRVVLGFSVSLQAASTVTVATCLAHACLPKQDWLARLIQI